MAKLSVIVLTLNEEANIGRCLASVRDLADEIIVVDCHSTDRTVDIAREYTERVFVREWPGRVQQTHFAVAQSTGDWILQLDADEEVSPELAESIRATLLDPPPDIHAYGLFRRDIFQGRWLHCCRVRGVRRLIRRAYARMPEQREHPYFDVPEPTVRLRGTLYHYVNQPLPELIPKLMHRAYLVAQDFHDWGRRFHWYHLLFNPWVRFLKMYFLQKGFLDGLPGLIICGIYFCYTFMVYAHLWGLERASRPEAQTNRPGAPGEAIHA